MSDTISDTVRPARHSTTAGQTGDEDRLADQLFAGPGEMRARCRAFDWAATPLGPVSDWPTALKAMVGLVLAAPLGMIVLWGAELVQLYNDGYREVMGAKHPAGLGQPTRACWPEVWAFNAPLYAGVVDRGEAFTFTDQRLVVERHGDAEEAFFTLTYSPVLDDAGRVGGVLVTVVETTMQVRARDARVMERERLLTESERARRQVEAQARLLAARTTELEASQNRLRLALDAAAMAFWDYDPRANATIRSPHHDWLYGYATLLEHWNFDTYLAHVHPDDRGYVADRFARALEHDEEWEVESRVVWPDGSIRWLATRGTVFRDADGTPNRVLGIVTDVTARKQADAEREQLFAEAQTARADAEAANRAKSEFLAVMSHELRTPLNAIGGYAELLELGIRGPVTEQQRHDLARIQQSQRHLLGLIAGVLDYSRVEAGAVTYRLTDVPVAEAIAEAEALVAPQVRAKGLGYSWAGAPPALRVSADREKLQQILLNLLGNAVKFTHTRDGVPGRIEVSCTVDPDGAVGDAPNASPGRVHIHVRDTGQGIAAEQLERIFEPFVQADQRLTRPHEGVGLGLAISRDLAHGMGGELRAESTPGEGSVFTLTLLGA